MVASSNTIELRILSSIPIPLETGLQELSVAVIPYTLFVFSSGFSMGPSVAGIIEIFPPYWIIFESELHGMLLLRHFL